MALSNPRRSSNKRQWTSPTTFVLVIVSLVAFVFWWSPLLTTTTLTPTSTGSLLLWIKESTSEDSSSSTYSWKDPFIPLKTILARPAKNIPTTFDKKLSRQPPPSTNVGVWKAMTQEWNVHSVLEVGSCSSVTAWFQIHQLRPVQCVVPSRQHDQQHFLLPSSWKPAQPQEQQTSLPLVVEHDYNRGPWWPAVTYDLAWVHEDIAATTSLLQNNPSNEENAVGTFRKAAILVVASSSNSAGTLAKDFLERYGFKQHDRLTEQVIAWDKNASSTAQSSATSMATWQVFLNPLVSALPEHAHLFYEPGCFVTMLANKEVVRRICGSDRKSKGDAAVESALPSDFMTPITTIELAAVKAQWQSFVKKSQK
ncbi:hypothetical protein ACA910_015585 [Epithemia clementina (nom. ined.)]